MIQIRSKGLCNNAFVIEQQVCCVYHRQQKLCEADPLQL